MKRQFILAVLALAVLAGTALAQADKKPAQAATPQAAQAQPAAAASNAPQPKTKEEFDAYNTAVREPDLAKAEAAADEFHKKFPDSQVAFMLYQNLMRRYRSANMVDKGLAMARRTLELEPDNAEALVTSAAILAESTKPTDLDKDDKYDEALRNSQHALEAIDTKLRVPATATPEQVEGYKNSLRTWAYSSMGAVNMAKEDWPAAETSLRKAVELTKSEPDPIVLYRLALTLDKEQKYGDALSFATQAEQLSANSPFGAQIRQEKQRLQQLASSPQPAPAPKQ